MPAFAGCTRRELRRVARWGDLIEVPTGGVLVRRDHSDWWFFVVVTGRVRLTHGRRVVGELRPGDHFGDGAVIGLRPVAATATAVEPSVVFALGPRYLLSLLWSSPGFRKTLVPDVAPAGYADYAKRMHDEGQAEWQRVAAAHAVTVDAPARAAPADGLLALAPPRGAPQRDRLPGRALSLAEAVQALAQLPSPPEAAQPPDRLRRRGWWLAPTAVVSAALAAVLFGYHPPRLVLDPGRPIDVVSDIRVTGVATYPPSGHYLLLWVKARQPTLAGLLGAWIGGRTIVGFDTGDESEQRAEGRAQYLDSRRDAIHLALHAAGVDPRRVSVHIRDEGFTGPSAGLVYALALDDLLSPGDLTRGRMVGVTGAVQPDGQVVPIGWLFLKVRGAVGDGATLLVVPAGQLSAAAGRVATTCGVTTFADALRALSGTGHDGGCRAAQLRH